MRREPREVLSLVHLSDGPAKLPPVKRRILTCILAAALAGAAGASPGASTAARAPADTCKPRIYRVQAGDTLFSIARRFKTTVRAIARANQLDPNGILRIGVRLRIPGASCRPPDPPKAKAAAP